MYIGEGQVHGHGVLSEAPRHCLLPTEDQVQWGEHHLLVQKVSFKGQCYEICSKSDQVQWGEHHLPVQKVSFKGTVPWDLLKIWPSSMRRASSPGSKGQLILKEQCHEICSKSDQVQWGEHHLLVQKVSFKGTVPWDLLKMWPSSKRRAMSPGSKGQL